MKFLTPNKERDYFRWDSLEGLVNGPEPTHIRAGCEHDEPDECQSKIGHSTTPEHPDKAANEVHRQCSTVDCTTEDTLHVKHTYMHLFGTYTDTCTFKSC